MKKMINLSLVVVSLLGASQVWAGWGSIACSNNTGACTWVQGAGEYQIAVDEALERCEQEYGNCETRRWEHNQCVEETASNGVSVQACY